MSANHTTLGTGQPQRRLHRALAAAGAAALAALAVACSDSTDRLTGIGGPSGAIGTSGYTAEVGDDWKSYATKDQLRAAGLFWWVDSAGRDVYDFVDLVQDPTFGRVARITFPANTGSSGSSPRIAQDLPVPLDRMWYRWRMKFAPGWTTVGPDPAGWANSYKIAFWTWKNYYGRGELEYSNTNQYVTGTGVQDPATGQYLRYTETLLPGSASDFGSTASEWSDGEWYEFVVYYEKTGPTSARQYYWRRRLTSGGAVVDNPWIFHGYEMSGSTTPQVAHVELGINKNKNNPTTMYLYWGPWEVVDGAKYPNPFGMPDLGTSTTTPTVTGLTVTPDTATVAPSGTLQFSARATMSDGTTQAVTPAWTTTGGTITSSGLYTAPSAAGTYRVIGSASGKADTAAVTVTSSSTGTTGGSSGTGAYSTLAGDDWRGYSGSAAVQSSGYFSGTTSNVALVSDPTFGQVVRVAQTAGSTSMPRLSKRFAAPVDRMWFRWRVKFSPGWTTRGSGGGPAQWTMAQWTWSGYGGAGSLGFQNGSEYATDWSARNSSNQYIRYAENTLPGSTPFGTAGAEWTSGDWWEFVVYWERTGVTTARQHYWKRRLTSGGTVVNDAWTYYGFTEDGSTGPQAAAIQLGGDLGRAPAATQYVYWGPWEVVDGSKYADPWGMPNV